MGTFVGGAQREVTHPSYQAWTHAALIRDFNVEVREGGIALHPCAYPHNRYDAATVKITLGLLPEPRQQPDPGDHPGIHTCQGLELDYVGVVAGEDLIARNGRVVTDAAKRARQDHYVSDADDPRTERLLRLQRGR